MLSSLNCKEHIGWDGGLHMGSVTMNTAETRSLVTAMARGVKVVRMTGGVTLDMEGDTGPVRWEGGVPDGADV